MFFSPQNDYYCKHLTRFRSILQRFYSGFVAVLHYYIIILCCFIYIFCWTEQDHFTTNATLLQGTLMRTRTKIFPTIMRTAKNLSQTYNGSRETFNPGLLQHSNLLVPFSRLLLPATPAQLFQHSYYYQLLLLPTTISCYYYPTPPL